jgi:hypothetical protein
MRLGSNPNKQVEQEQSQFLHQVIVPVYIPNEEGYFVDALKILTICLESLFNTIHNRTFITVVNNGSCENVVRYLDTLFSEKKIHELTHTDSIGKINAVFKGLSGNNIPLVTITDADVLFLSGWQIETMKIFSTIPKAGVVGIVPQFKMYTTLSGNTIFDNLFNNRLQFLPITHPEGIIHFYDSIGWGRDYNPDYLKLGLGLEYDDVKCLVGAGHFVATYKKDIFDEIDTFIGGKKVAGIGEAYIDRKGLKKDYWRLTTQGNYAYHMGNVYEDWMVAPSKDTKLPNYPQIHFPKRNKINPMLYFVKNRIIKKLITFRWLLKLFFRWKKLPKEMIEKY